MMLSDLRKLNSATKYPSIDTYHPIDSKTGMLSEGPMSFSGRVIATEKIDGANTRIILRFEASGDVDYVIGSREEMLHARGDRIPNPALGIVDTAKPFADAICEKTRLRYSSDSGTPRWPQSLYSRVFVLYGETFGGSGITAASKQYSTQKKSGFRLFDVLALGISELDEILLMPIEKIAGWRDRGGQNEFFLSNSRIVNDLVDDNVPWSLPQMMFQPPIIEIGTLPCSIEDTARMLRAVSTHTRVSLDGLDIAGKSEGIVIRTDDRRTIAKLRHEDYDRTLRKRDRRWRASD